MNYLFQIKKKMLWVLPMKAMYENALNLLDIIAFAFAPPFLNPYA